jgi:glycosyltransferase involved in cell wall biosynthesis
VIALSPDIARWIIEHFDVPADRVSVIPNAVDVAAFPPRDAAARQALRSSLGLDDNTFVLGYLGALSTEKRPMLAVEAVAALPDAHLLLAGDGPLRAELEEAAAALAPGRIHLLGAVRRPAEMLSAIDALLLPSQTEGMPASLIEAALVGAPVVATAVGAVPELVAELGCGTVVPADDPSAFVQAVRDFRPADYDMATARDTAAQYDIAAVVDRWVEVIGNAPVR